MHLLKNFNIFPNRIIIHKSPCDWKQQFCNGNVTATLNIAFTTVKTVITDAHKCLAWWINTEKEVCVGICGVGGRVPYKHTGLNRQQWWRHSGINLTFYTVWPLSYLQLPIHQLDKIMTIQRQVEKKERTRMTLLLLFWWCEQKKGGNKKEQTRQGSCFAKGQSIYIDWDLWHISWSKIVDNTLIFSPIVVVNKTFWVRENRCKILLEFLLIMMK